MTLDFLDDACDLLEKDEDFSFILVGAHYNSRNAHARYRIRTRQHLEWLKERFDEFYERTKETLPE